MVGRSWECHPVLMCRWEYIQGHTTPHSVRLDRPQTVGNNSLMSPIPLCTNCTNVQAGIQIFQCLLLSPAESGGKNWKLTFQSQLTWSCSCRIPPPNISLQSHPNLVSPNEFWIREEERHGQKPPTGGCKVTDCLAFDLCSCQLYQTVVEKRPL